MISGQKKAEVMELLLREDRTEIRTLKKQLRDLCILVVSASFAITAFFLGAADSIEQYATPGSADSYLIAVEIGFIAIFILLAQRELQDLTAVRGWMTYRQQRYCTYLNEESERRCFDPFEVGSLMETNQQKGIRDGDVWWLCGCTLLILFLKMSLTIILLFLIEG